MRPFGCYRGWKVPSMVTENLIDRLRSPPCAECEFEDAIESAADVFRGIGGNPAASSGGILRWLVPAAVRGLIGGSSGDDGDGSSSSQQLQPSGVITIGRRRRKRARL